MPTITEPTHGPSPGQEAMLLLATGARVAMRVTAVDADGVHLELPVPVPVEHVLRFVATLQYGQADAVTRVDGIVRVAPGSRTLQFLAAEDARERDQRRPLVIVPDAVTLLPEAGGDQACRVIMGEADVLYLLTASEAAQPGVLGDGYLEVSRQEAPGGRAVARLFAGRVLATEYPDVLAFRVRDHVQLQRRQHARLRHQAPAAVSELDARGGWVGVEHRATLRDISVGGASLNVEGQLSSPRLYVRVRIGELAVETAATVVREQPPGTVSVRFDTLPQTAADALHDRIFRLLLRDARAVRDTGG